VLARTLLVRSPNIGLKAYVALPVPAGTLDTAAGQPTAPGPRAGNVTTDPEVDMMVLIVSVGILLALVVTLTFMGRRERRTRDAIALDESGVLDARRHRDATGSR